MIPTRLKKKLPRRLSYPVGAQELSERLQGTPHVEALELVFWDRPNWSALEFQRWLRERTPYTILQGEFQPKRSPGVSGCNSFVERGWYDEKWEITVYPVLQELRHLAHQLLRSEGLEYLARWVKGSLAKGWLLRRHRCELIFSPAEETIAVRESDES